MSEPFLPPGIHPPAPPDGLRVSALRAARAAFETAPPPDLWSRLAASPAARLAWAVAMLLLAVAHLLVPARGASRTAAAVSRTRRLQESREPEIRVLARLPRIEERALPAREGERS